MPSRWLWCACSGQLGCVLRQQSRQHPLHAGPRAQGGGRGGPFRKLSPRRHVHRPVAGRQQRRDAAAGVRTRCAAARRRSVHPVRSVAAAMAAPPPCLAVAHNVEPCAGAPHKPQDAGRVWGFHTMGRMHRSETAAADGEGRNRIHSAAVPCIECRAATPWHRGAFCGPCARRASNTRSCQAAVRSVTPAHAATVMLLHAAVWPCRRGGPVHTVRWPGLPAALVREQRQRPPCMHACACGMQRLARQPPPDHKAVAVCWNNRPPSLNRDQAVASAAGGCLCTPS